MFFARAVTLLLLLCAAASSQAQDRPIRPSRFAVDVSYKLGAPVTFDRASGRLVHFGSTKTGTSKDESFGLGLSLGYNISKNFELSLGAGYRRGNGQFKSDVFSLADTQRMEFTIDTKYDAIDIDLLAGYKLNSWLRLLGGISMALYPSNDATQTRRLIQVAGSDRNESAVFASGDDILGKPVHVTLPVGVRVPLWRVSESSTIGLDVLGGLNMTEGLRGYWGQAANLKVGIWWAPLEEDHVEQPLSAPAPVRAKLEDRSSFNRDGRSDTLYVQVIDSIRTFLEAIPQTIYFDPDRSTFVTARGVSSIELVLAKISDRLNADSLARLQIELHRGEDESREIDQQRSMLFTNALSNSSTISIAKQQSGLGHALLSSNDPALLLPIRTSETAREQWVEGLSIKQYSIAEAGVKRWSLIVRTESDTLFAFGTGTKELSAFDELTFAIPANTRRLYLHSFVIDNQDERSDSYDTLFVATTLDAGRDVRIDEYILLNQPAARPRTFSYDAAMLDAIVGSITASSMIEVSNLLDEGLDDMTRTVASILDGCKKRGVMPRKIEATPMSSAGSHSSATDATYGNAVRVRVMTAGR